MLKGQKSLYEDIYKTSHDVTAFTHGQLAKLQAQVETNRNSEREATLDRYGSDLDALFWRRPTKKVLKSVHREAAKYYFTQIYGDSLELINMKVSNLELKLREVDILGRTNDNILSLTEEGAYIVLQRNYKSKWREILEYIRDHRTLVSFVTLLGVTSAVVGLTVDLPGLFAKIRQ